MGDGSSPHSLSRADIGRHAGCQLPDAILHGKRSSFGLIAGPSNASRRLDYRVRPLSPLRLVVAPPACGPGQDTFMIPSPRLDPVARVGHRFWRCVGPRLRVWPLTSQVAFAHKSAVPFLASPTFRKFWRTLPWSVFLPGSVALFVPPFGVFHWADLLSKTARVACPVLAHSSNHLPSG